MKSYNSYRSLVIMLACSMIIMYVVMFLNVAQRDHVYLSLTRVYMTLLMVSPMALLMLIMMPQMYPKRSLNLTIGSMSIVVFVLALICLRNQIGIGDIQYMQAMIPHHSSAILTSTHADIQNPQVRQLADDIIQAQEEEIAEMKEVLERLK